MAEQDLKKQITALFDDISEAETESLNDDLTHLFSDSPASPLAVPMAGEEPATSALILEPPPAKQSPWANDPMLRMAADENEAVATVALDTLVHMGSKVRTRVLGLAQQPTVPLHAGGIAYLAHLLAQPLVYVPPGHFIMGSDPDTDPASEPRERPTHYLSLPGYWLSRYPVTVAHFQTFIQESGYQPAGRHTTAGAATEPVIDVTWHDALAYCRWLSERSHLPVTLPSEAQWEKAARGEDGRPYPWGQTRPTATLCNFDRSPVGQFSPQGDSPYGCSDMVGNVWEWTRSSYRAYPYIAQDGREDMTTPEPRVVRGVTFSNLGQYARCAYRYPLKQNMHLLTLGFRVVVDPN